MAARMGERESRFGFAGLGRHIISTRRRIPDESLKEVPAATGRTARTHLPCPASAHADAPKKVVTIEGITEYQLDNGLRVLLFPDPSTPRVTVNRPSSSARATRATARPAWPTCSSTWSSRARPTFPDVPKALARPRGRLQRHHLGRPHQLLRDHAGHRREPRVRHPARGRPPGQQLRQARGPGHRR